MYECILKTQNWKITKLEVVLTELEDCYVNKSNLALFFLK